MLVRQLLIWFKYYHLVYWWRGFDQEDVTTTPREKIELWLCNEVQELVKIVITWCIDDLLEVKKWLATLRKFRRIRIGQCSFTKLDQVDKWCREKLVQAE